MSAEAPAARRWVRAGLTALALLVVPIVTWLALPSPGVAGRERAGEGSAEDASAAGAKTRAKAPPRAQPSAPRAANAPAASREEGIDGEVVDPDGKPAADASISCVLGDREHTAQADESGHFQLGADAAGCTAVARLHGFAPSIEAVLRAGSANRLRLAPPTGIAGNVVDETGAPVMQYWIAVEAIEPLSGTGPDGGSRPPQKISLEVNSQEGTFEWTDLAPGRYSLALGVPMRPFVRQRGIEVRAGAVTRGVRFVSTPGVTVTGKVTDAKTGQPLDGALVFVELGLDLGLKVLPGMTSAGEFKLEGAPAGAFDLHVTLLGYTEHVQRLSAPAGSDSLRVDVALRKTGE